MTATRRQFIAGVGGCLASGVASSGAGPLGGLGSPPALAAEHSLPSLWQEAAKAGVEFGASASREIFANPAYANLYRQHAKLLTTDVALKFDHVRWREKEWDFKEADRLLQFASDNDKLLRGHTLIWNENAPPWLKGRSHREIIRIFDEYIDKAVGRYAGQLHSMDVVNEPFWPGHGKHGGFRNGPWLEAMGPRYIARALKRAKQADPSLKLVLNEGHCERNDWIGRTVRHNMVQLVDRLLDNGIPLHAVGLQGHLQPDKSENDQAFTDFLWQLHERKIDLYITEFDLDDLSYGPTPSERDLKSAERTRRFFQSVLKVPSIKAVICWQLSDRYSWYRNQALEQDPKRAASLLPRPLPFDGLLQPKPSFHALVDAFHGRAISTGPK